MGRRPSRFAVKGFERTRRGKQAVLVCLSRRNYPGHENERCPYHVIIAVPGLEAVEAEAVRAAEHHLTTWHGGTIADGRAVAIGGQLEQTGDIGR
jgi:hypothetical protein